jgi:Ca-activated chloride channel family protein
MEISETTGSNARHIVNIEDLFGYMQDEIKKARHEMDESVNIKLEAVNGFKVVKVYKIYPNILDFQVQDGNLLMKNLKYDEENIFVFEVLVPNKKAGKTKFFESSFNQFLGNEKTDISKEELFLEYTNDEFDAAVVDNKVLFYLQQYNVQKSIQKIEHLISNREIEKASNLIENTIKIAKRTNNSFILNTLEKLRVEIERNNINENTTKTLTVETKTKTVKLEDKNIKMSEKEIRQKSGT